MPLDGVNRKCARCKQNCKQWKQVKVLICPNFVDVTKSDGKFKKQADAKHSKTPKSALSAIQTPNEGKATIIALKTQEGA